VMGLTRQQADCLRYITSCIDAVGMAPSYSEMQRYLGIGSRSGAHRIVKALEERGAVRRLPGRARAIEICPTRDVLRSFSDAALLAEVERRAL
jgi:repressor LexA